MCIIKGVECGRKHVDREREDGVGGWGVGGGAG